MVSILIPIFNTKKKWLVECFDSIFNQTYKDYEIVIVNDGSTTTDTLEFLDDIKKNKKTNVINLLKNVGLPTALNVGLRACRCKYVARMDSDDVMLPHRIEKQVDYLNAHEDVDLLSTGLNYLRLIDSNWVISDLIIHPSVITKDIAKHSNWFVNHPTVMYKKSKILSIGGYDEALRSYPEDFDLWIRMIKNGMVLHNLHESFLLLRISNDTLSKTNINVTSFCEKLRSEL